MVDIKCMVERFNGRISEVLHQTRFASATQLEDTLMNYAKTYNHHIPQRALGGIPPVQALKNWQAKKPDLFKKRVYKQAGLENRPDPAHPQSRTTPPKLAKLLPKIALEIASGKEKALSF